MTRVALLLLTALPCSALAQNAPPRCDGPEHRHFDFWAGEWSVQGKNGKHAGDNTITPILDGCALREEWSGASGYTGTSLNFYDRATGHWHQTWIANDGQPLFLEGALDDQGRMVMSSEGGDRITWTPNPDGTVRQLWERSADGGATWSVLFDGLYTRKETVAPR
jgi:hypothetical protein